MDDISEELLELAASFRRRLGFLAIIGVAFTCQVYLMTMLRPVLEPFLSALFVVMVMQPLARTFEAMLLCIGNLVCIGRGGCRKRSRGKRRRRKINKGSCDQDIELKTFGKEATPPNDEDSQGEDAGFNEDHWNVKASEHQRLDNQDHPDEDCCASSCASIAHLLSVCFAMLVIMGFMFGFAMLIIDAASQVKDNFATYEEGARNCLLNIKIQLARIFGKMPRSIVDEISENALAGAKALVSELLAEALSHTGKMMVEFVMLALYVMFWMCTPMPLNTKTERIFRRYLFLKGAACLFYGISVGIMLFMLNVNLALFFGLMSFFFSLLPEVGAFIAMVLPIPVILFDSKLRSPFFTLVIATAGQLGLKFFFANIVEVKLVEHDATMKMHPVVTLLSLSFFGFIWGPTGMLLSVPLMAYMKVVILSDLFPPSYRDPVLVFLEGDRRAPERHLRRAAARATPHTC